MQIGNNLIRIFDNEGKSFDRYTIIIDNAVYGMSINPYAQLAFNQFCCMTNELRDNFYDTEKELSIIPNMEIAKAISERIED